ncbi:unnamed protein product [Musa acuminata subsp. burmannicoides]
MSEHEARDLMSVDSFSQLPFIRPAPKPSTTTSGIRLFGIEVPHHPNVVEDDASKDNTAITSGAATTTVNGGSGSGRRFECHYCCRHFPTSQALGGHQNAHKRERQHAKRAYLQSAAMAAAQHNQAAIYAHHVHGLFNYHHCLGPPSSSAARFAVEPSSAPHYPSWHATDTLNGSFGAFFHGGLGSLSQPIDGSPLPGIWRVPGVMHGGGARIGAIHGDSRMPSPMFRGDNEPRLIGVGGGVGSDGNAHGTPPASPKDQFAHQFMPSAKENVSLDLHL